MWATYLKVSVLLKPIGWDSLPGTEEELCHSACPCPSRPSLQFVIKFNASDIGIGTILDKG